MLRTLAIGLAEALVAIHRAGLVHRDLKPANVLMSPTGPRVIDFGIAAAVDATSSTRSGLVVDSLGYLAPEQILTDVPVGPPTDVFAWALTVLYAASGRPPFGTGRPDVLLYRVLHEKPDISAVPDTLAPLVTAALRHDPPPTCSPGLLPTPPTPSGRRRGSWPAPGVYPPAPSPAPDPSPAAAP